MANSRFDNIRYFDETFKIPGQIKVHDGSTWVDLGAKDSYNTEKLVVYNDNNFDCVTYARRDINIPKTIQLGAGKYLDLRKTDGSNLSVDNYHGGYYVDMTVEVNETTPLYTVYSKNMGDITNQAYNNYEAEVSGNSVRLHILSRFSGISISSRQYVDSTLDKYTAYAWQKGQKVRIYLSRSENSGQLNIKIYNEAGSKIYETNVYETTQWVGTPNYHRIGSKTDSTSGTQKTGGNAKMYSFKIYHPDLNRTYTFNFNNASSGDTEIASSDSAAKAVAVGTSVYGRTDVAYDRQSI